MIPTRRRFIKIAAAQAAAFALANPSKLLSAPQSATLRPWKGIVLGAEASIQLNCDSERKANHVLKTCVSEIQRLERIFSLYDELSDLAQLNKNKYLKNPPAELVELLRIALRIGRETDGVFDISIQPIIEAYREHFSKTNTGLPAHLKQVKKAVDYRQIEVSKTEIRLLNPTAALTLNGIAQGFITDRVADLLRAEGFGHTLIDLGEKRALDSHPEGRDWQLGLANASGVHDVVQLNNKALSSSGGYGTPFDESGKFHHLIDPRTGLSVNHHASVHVTAKTATLADALSTALATCRREEAAKIEQRFPEANVFRS